MGRDIFKMFIPPMMIMCAITIVCTMLNYRYGYVPHGISIAMGASCFIQLLRSVRKLASHPGCTQSKALILYKVRDGMGGQGMRWQGMR